VIRFPELDQAGKRAEPFLWHTMFQRPEHTIEQRLAALSGLNSRLGVESLKTPGRIIGSFGSLAPKLATDPVPADSLLSGGTLLCSAPHGPDLIPLADSRPQTFCGSVQQKSRLLAFFARMRIR
jgi:hypothetical protein